MVARCPTANARAGWNASPSARARLDEFAHAESRDGGKPLALARDVEIPRAISNLRFFAHAATQFASESHHGQAGLNYTLRQPLGVVGLHLALEPAAVPVHLEDRARARGRQHRRRQAVRGHAADGVDARRTRGGDRLPARRAQHRARPRPRRRRGARRAPAARRRSRSPAAPRSAAHRRRSPRRCSRSSRWSSAARTRRSCSPTRLGRALDTIVRSAFQNSGQICLCGSRMLVERRIYAEFRDALRRTRARAARRRSARRGHRPRPAGVAGALRQGPRRHRARAQRRRPVAVRRRRRADAARAGSSRRR